MTESHPATGIYPSSCDVKKCTCHYDSDCSTTSIESASDIAFKPVELVLPSDNSSWTTHSQNSTRTRVSGCRSRTNFDEHEHLLISKCVNRHFAPSIGSSTTKTYDSCETNSTFGESYGETRRLESIGNIFSSIFNFFKNNPTTSKYILIGLFFYAAFCSLEIILPRLASFAVRLMYPWARYTAVVFEQIFSTISNLFNRLDGLLYATYCEFAAKYCRNHHLMCDVRCSFVDHVLSQARPHLTQAPQQ
ncbi:unnamed protein product [Caenorhabditis bovis]|uniref:Uncharacterized protein n=1 Tax=Caenorhabditis bovis TaxID=2654633 RepID=A0A8S1F610_9PELO|nr:unnamed protein product [Caenorhabditis bovis]